MRAAAQNAPSGLHRPELDGLRFFAFLAVFLHHALPDDVATWMRWGVSRSIAEHAVSLVITGSVGVDFFLCLSAYLITTLLLRERSTYGDFDYKAFLVRRALRIWPLYYAFLAFVIFVWPSIAGESLSPRQTIAFLVFASNWECGFFGYPMSILAPLWSIALEEQFYLVWPLVLRVGTRRIAHVLVSLVVLAACARFVHVYVGGGSQMLWCNTVTRLDPMALGALLAVRTGGRASSLGRGARSVILIAALTVIVVTTSLVPLHRDPLTRGVIPSFTVVALACTAIVWAALVPAGEERSVFAHPGLVYLGRISYGLYVFHMLGIRTARALLSSISAPFAAELALALVCTLAFAALSYRFIEQPFLQLKSRFSRAQPAAPERLAPISDASDRIFQAPDTNRM